jgi:PAS domain S-box-containing protein
MPFSRPPATIGGARRALWEGLALILAPALALGALEIYQITHINPQLFESQRAVAHAIDVISATETLQRGLQEAINNEREYLVTGNAGFLAGYDSGIQSAHSALLAAKNLTLDNPEQQARWPSVERRMAVMVDVLNREIDARRTAGFDAARAIVSSNLGGDTVRSIDQDIDAAIAAEKALMQRREATGTAASGSDISVDIIAGCIVLLIVVTGGLLVVATFRRTIDSARALAASDGRVRGLIESAPDAMIITDRRGLIVLVNAQAERLFGFTRRELIGQLVDFLIPEPWRVEYARRRNEYLDDPGPRPIGTGLELNALRKDGSELPIEVSLSVYQSDDELFVSASIRDITPRREAEVALVRERQERERAEAQLRQSQKMEALGQLTGGIAHDFNNMIGVIIGSLELLRSRTDFDGEKRISDPIRLALEGAERCAGLTRRLLAFSRQQPLEPRPVDFNRMVSGMSGLLRRTLGENISIETVQAGGLWAASADLNQIENALLNLALNARDAMPAGGRLTIETANAWLDEAYAAANDHVARGQYVMLAVSDSGIGMAPETIERAFEPFFSTKEAGQGTGLGLSQVYGFIKQSNGHIKIYSEIGEGTTVKIYLPRATTRVDVDEKRIESMQPADAAATILMVEDNELLLESVALMLRELGYRVLVAEDGTGALALLAEEADVQLLFTDVGLPGALDGRQLADEVRRRRPEVKILFTTGYTRNAVMHDGRLDPDVEFIGKPFQFAALIGKIQRLLAEPVR